MYRNIDSVMRVQPMRAPCYFLRLVASRQLHETQYIRFEKISVRSALYGRLMRLRDPGMTLISVDPALTNIPSGV